MVDVVESVRRGAYTHTWTPIVSEARGHRARIWVSGDALKIDGVRVSVSAKEQQQIADILGASLCTTKVCDLAWDQADIRIRPKLQKPENDPRRRAKHKEETGEDRDPGMSSWLATRMHSLDVDLDITTGFLARNVGKTWVLSDRCTTALAANYGWYDLAAPKHHVSWSGYRMWQTLGTGHNQLHKDYSQTAIFMRDGIEIDGAMYTLGVVMKHPEYSHLINDDGIMKVCRLPGVAPPAVAPILVAAPDLGEVKFKQAKNYRKGRTAQVDLIVLHTMEAVEKPNTAENVAAWFAGSQAPMASAHYCVDADSIVQCVWETDVAFHAPGANHNGIGIEHAGYAKQSAEEWSDEYSMQMLARSARLSASLCYKYQLPVEFVDAAGLLAGKRGITTHAEVSKAFKKSTHTDPGKNFPMVAYLDAVRKAMS